MSQVENIKIYSKVCTHSMSTFRSSSKDKSSIDEATICYRVLKDII